MDPVGPHGQTSHFHGQMNPEEAMDLVGPHGKKSHFQGQTSPGADLSYGASWPSRPKWPIFKVKRSPMLTSVKTLVMELVGPHDKNGPFSMSNEPQTRILTSILPKFFMDVR
ncbi:hypothetical protein H5410_054498 [Solanum commersonii]|uniref:Uncharacterized protein n=1 Tax=Solanum commersonii TaxID=4109 RepID=A0A9J5WGJ9_SOLCO|nr:hypothetical protein H5410_054498 [Solanum commersonii]